MEDKNFSYIDLMLLFVSFLWGLNPVIMKIGLKYVEPFTFNLVRICLSAVFSWIFLFISKSYKKVERKDYKDILLISILGFFIFQYFYALGVKMTTSGNVGLILAFLPICVAIISRIFKIEKISREMVTGIVLSIIGVVFVILGGGNSINIFDQHILGSLLTFIAVFSYGYYTVFSKRLAQKYSRYQIIPYTLTICTLAFIPLSYKELLEVNWKAIPMAFWLACFYSGVLSISLANIIWIWGIEKIGSTKTSVYNNFTPIFALIGGYIILKETLKPLQFIGIPIVFLGLYLTRAEKGFFKKKREDEKRSII